MNELEPILLDELRREFRRTRPPAKAIHGDYTPGIFRLTDCQRTGYRVFWFHASAIAYPCTFQHENTLFELIEILDLP